VSADWKAEIEAALAAGEEGPLLALARRHTPRFLRYLTGRLCSSDEQVKWRAVRALGLAAADRSLVDERRGEETLRRFAWALNDESGAVPYGVPEAIGEVLAVRPEFRETFLPILCSLVTLEEMSQTGPIERGALWALGRVGPETGRYCAGAVEAIRRAALSHPDGETRAVAARALDAIAGRGYQ
jgi:HEAT repeat protein